MSKLKRFCESMITIQSGYLLGYGLVNHLWPVWLTALFIFLAWQVVYFYPDLTSKNP